MNPTEHYDVIMFLTSMPSAEQTQNRKQEKWIDAHSRSTDKPRMEYSEDQNGTITHIRAVQGQSHGVIIPPFLFFERDTVELA